MKNWLDRLEKLLKPAKSVTGTEDLVDSIILYAILALLIFSLF